jgi:predicted nucleic acid-binding protein
MLFMATCERAWNHPGSCCPHDRYDLLIAAHAMTLHATLVTDDQGFGRVPGLPVENWIRA